MPTGVVHGLVGECRTVTLAVALAGEEIVNWSTEKSALKTEVSKTGFVVDWMLETGLSAIV